jgi:DNA-damage-inducible protein J
MNTADTYVRARIDEETKARAADALEAMGLSISDAIRLLMLRIADERRLPFEVKVPNATTRKAVAELESGKGKKFRSVKALMADLHAGDWAIERSTAFKRASAGNITTDEIHGTNSNITIPTAWKISSTLSGLPNSLGVLFVLLWVVRVQGLVYHLNRSKILQLLLLFSSFMASASCLLCRLAPRKSLVDPGKTCSAI